MLKKKKKRKSTDIMDIIVDMVTGITAILIKMRKILLPIIMMSLLLMKRKRNIINIQLILLLNQKKSKRKALRRDMKVQEDQRKNGHTLRKQTLMKMDSQSLKRLALDIIPKATMFPMEIEVAEEAPTEKEVLEEAAEAAEANEAVVEIVEIVEIAEIVEIVEAEVAEVTKVIITTRLTNTIKMEDHMEVSIEEEVKSELKLTNPNLEKSLSIV
jgi:hypothetical protein